MSEDLDLWSMIRFPPVCWKRVCVFYGPLIAVSILCQILKRVTVILPPTPPLRLHVSIRGDPPFWVQNTWNLPVKSVYRARLFPP